MIYATALIYKEDSVKNHADAMIFRTAICAEASQICHYRRAKSDI